MVWKHYWTWSQFPFSFLVKWPAMNKSYICYYVNGSALSFSLISLDLNESRPSQQQAIIVLHWLLFQRIFNINEFGYPKIIHIRWFNINNKPLFKHILKNGKEIYFRNLTNLQNCCLQRIYIYISSNGWKICCFKFS